MGIYASQVLASFEGGLEGQDDLMALMTGSGLDLFDWAGGREIGSTYHRQVRLRVNIHQLYSSTGLKGVEYFFPGA